MRTLLAAFCLLALTAPAIAGEVGDNSVWYGAGVTVSADVGADTTTTPATATLTVTDPSGASNTAAASMGAHGTVQNPTASDSDTATTPGGKYRAKDGKLQRLNKRGRWVNMTKSRTKTTGTVVMPEFLNQGELAPRDGKLQTIHGTYGLLEGQPAPWDGWFIDEVTSLPGDPRLQ